MNSTISGNSSNSLGGGIYTSLTANIINSTVSGNTVTGGFGGGLYNSGTLDITGSTISRQLGQRVQPWHQQRRRCFKPWRDNDHHQHYRLR